MSLDIAQYDVHAIPRDPPATVQRVLSELGGIAWNLPIEHWSPSSFDMFNRCPYQWQQRYIHGRKERPGEAPTLGSAVHSAVELNYGQKIETHADVPLVELLDWYSEVAFPQTILDQQERAGEEVLWDTSPEQARDRGRVMLSAYQHGVAPRVQPLEVEQVVSVDFGLAVPVEGRFDVSREQSVVDVKTGKRKTTKPKESWRIQAAVYGEARARPVEFHSVTAGVRQDGSLGTVNVVTPLESEDLLVHPPLPQRQEMRRTLQAISAVACMYMDIYGPDEPWPTKGRFHPWACDYCGFISGCPAWKGSER